DTRIETSIRNSQFEIPIVYQEIDQVSGIKRVLLVVLVFCISNSLSVLPYQAAATQKGKQQASGTSWVEKTLASMSLDEKVGQLIIPAAIGMFMYQDGDAFQQMKRDVTDFHV